MSLQVQFQPLASIEVSDAACWYDEQRPGLGNRFLTAVNTAIERAARWPHAGTPVEVASDGTVLIRKVTTVGFPYAVGYELSGNALTVLAVFHQHDARTTGPPAKPEVSSPFGEPSGKT